MSPLSKVDQMAAVIWFRCASGGLHELTSINQTSNCRYQAAIDTPLACSEEGSLKLWNVPMPGGSHKWQCTPEQHEAATHISGQWSITGTGTQGR